MRPMINSRVWLTLALGLTLGLAAMQGAVAKTPGEVEVGGVLRDAVMRGLNGPDRKLSSYRGKPLVINVWASWCPPCLQEMASLERLAWSEAGQKFTVIGISTDDYADAAKARLLKNSATLNHYIDHKLELENMLGADHLPLTLLVDAKGRVLSKTTGAREWDSDESKAMINKAFRIAPAAKP